MSASQSKPSCATRSVLLESEPEAIEAPGREPWVLVRFGRSVVAPNNLSAASCNCHIGGAPFIQVVTVIDRHENIYRAVEHDGVAAIEDFKYCGVRVKDSVGRAHQNASRRGDRANPSAVRC